MKIIPPSNRSDKYGSGHFGDRRSKTIDGQKVYYPHTGVDKPCYPGSGVIITKHGKVTKIGYPYGDDLSFRYVEVTDYAGYVARYMYVKPIDSLKVGDRVTPTKVIGYSQELGKRYPGITEHVHCEVRDLNGEYFDFNMYYLRK